MSFTSSLLLIGIGITVSFVFWRWLALRAERKESVKGFLSRVADLREMNKQIETLKKESTRGTVDFEEALRKHRAKFGGGTKSDDGGRNDPAS